MSKICFLNLRLLKSHFPHLKFNFYQLILEGHRFFSQKKRNKLNAPDWNCYTFQTSVCVIVFEFASNDIFQKFKRIRL